MIINKAFKCRHHHMFLHMAEGGSTIIYNNQLIKGSSCFSVCVEPYLVLGGSLLISLNWGDFALNWSKHDKEAVKVNTVKNNCFNAYDN